VEPAGQFPSFWLHIRVVAIQPLINASFIISLPEESTNHRRTMASNRKDMRRPDLSEFKSRPSRANNLTARMQLTQSPPHSHPISRTARKGRQHRVRIDPIVDAAHGRRLYAQSICRMVSALHGRHTGRPPIRRSCIRRRTHPATSTTS